MELHQECAIRAPTNMKLQQKKWNYSIHTREITAKYGIIAFTHVESQQNMELQHSHTRNHSRNMKLQQEYVIT